MLRLVFALTIGLLSAGVAAAQDHSAAQAMEERLARSRAMEAVIWGMPAVNTLLMYDQMIAAGGKVGEIIYWGRPLDWHNQTLTPNPDTLYFMGFYDLGKSGPVVVEIPPAGNDGSLNANFVTLWQTSLEDAGLLGIDKGAGVKFVITPPGFKGKLPRGVQRLAADTNTGYFLMRSNLRSHGEADVAKSIAYGKRVRFYPLSEAKAPPQTVYRDIKDADFDSTIKYDPSFFTLLDRVVQSEPWLPRDRAMIDQLRTIGIERGKPYAPDAAASKAQQEGIADARAWLEARYDAGFPAFFEGTHWTMPTMPETIQGQSTTYAEPDKYPVDARGIAYTYAYIAIKRLGVGQFYLINIKDKTGKSYDGARSYKLHVPPDVPVEQYWSVTVYDRETHALLKGADRASRASNAADVKKNADGSVDIYFGPKAPEGMETNWVPTIPGRQFELMFRLYGPTQRLFDKAWTLADVEPV